jgi:hypothetical protein
MKKIIGILAILFFAFSFQGLAQCNVQSSKGSNGVTFKYMNAEFVGAGSGCELGVSFSTNGKNYFFNTNIKYPKKAVKSEGTLTIALKNNQSINLKLYNCQVNSSKKPETVMGVYSLNASDIDKLKKAAIDKIVFQESGGKNQSVTVVKNSDVAIKQLKCLE